MTTMNVVGRDRVHRRPIVKGHFRTLGWRTASLSERHTLEHNRAVRSSVVEGERRIFPPSFGEMLRLLGGMFSRRWRKARAGDDEEHRESDDEGATS
jgi:hypothetical protein